MILPEILAPAGSPACALAAFEAGADAIYAGLSKFNARERGENFTPEVMAQIVDHAHKLGKKVYVAYFRIRKHTCEFFSIEILTKVVYLAVGVEVEMNRSLH